ncbi:hypothetical protein [Pseudoalteromonas denitrificans]|uniref:hypothetical protein n=1 Tax=Pseudoalteromonas denitrificans TaxID=43656 RepID=UPI0015A62049|nr:hypothetical protein [Pseudoalteromonas denitrificans]
MPLTVLFEFIIVSPENTVSLVVKGVKAANLVFMSISELAGTNLLLQGVQY